MPRSDTISISPGGSKQKSCVGKNLKNPRPVNLDLTTIRFPVTAIASILHRISGVITFGAIGFLLWLLSLSLSSQEGFLQTAAIITHPVVKSIFWCILVALAYHIIGGIRHLLMDFGVLSETLESSIFSARLVFFITAILSLLAGVFIW